MEEEQKQDQEQEQNIPAQAQELNVEQTKKNIIPTRFGSLIILLAAIIAAVAVQWYADFHFPPNGIEISGLVRQMQERREVKNELPEGYEIKADGVYYMGELMEEADSEMFERLGGSYIKYKNDIYFSGERIEGLDIATFEYLGGSYVKDKDHVYYPFIRGLDSEFGIIKEADMETFEYLDYFYAKDKNHVYELGEVSEEENWRTGEISEEKDPATFEILNRYITKDKNNVYYYVLTSAKGIFREADPETFEILGDRYYKDKGNVYYDYNDYNKIEGANPETFEVLSEGYSKDKNNVYKRREIVEGVDPANCTVENIEDCEGSIEVRNTLSEFVKNGTFYKPRCGAAYTGETYVDDLGLTCSVDSLPIDGQMKITEAEQERTMIDSYGFQLRLFSDLDGDGDEDAIVLIREFSGRLNVPFLAIVEYQDGEASNIDTIVIEGDTAEINIQELETGILNVKSCGWYSKTCWKYNIEYSEGELHIISREESKKEVQQACLASGTKVLMADGGHKNIENIKIGDMVTSYEFETKEYKTAKVNKTIKRKDPLVIINNTLRAAPDELVYLADGTVKEAVDIKIGDYLINEKGEQVEVNTVEQNTELVDTYDFTLENGDNFFADGYLVGTPDL